jgi:CPA2 family monovalent cation:H+ antiporter-2
VLDDTLVDGHALACYDYLGLNNRQIAVGWLVVEDLVMVLVLVLVPALSGLLSATPTGEQVADYGLGLWATIGWTLAKVAAFIAIMLVVGRRLLPRVLWWVARTGSRELFTLSVIAVALGVAFGAASLFDVSFALGAFFAGMMLRESEFSHRAADQSLPLRDAFAVLFFVSVGMLFDPSILWTEPLRLLAVVGIIMLGKTIAAVVLVLVFRYGLQSALTIGASLAQIGEFSFILAGLGVALGLMPEEGRSLVLASALISVALNPAIFSGIEPLRNWILKRSALARRVEYRDDPLAHLPVTAEAQVLAGQVVLVGYGRVGRRIAEALGSEGIAFVVAEQNREKVEALRAAGIQAVCGDAAAADVLVQAHIAQAAMLIIAVPDPVNVRNMAQTARTLNPEIALVLRTHSEEEAGLLAQETQGTVFLGEHELARGMTRHILGWLRPTT